MNQDNMTLYISEHRADNAGRNYVDKHHRRLTYKTILTKTRDPDGSVDQGWKVAIFASPDNGGKFRYYL